MRQFDLRHQAEARGVEYIEKPNGHIQLRGPLLVNYYPSSKSKSAYVAGTKKAARNVTPAQALAMCFEVPKSQGIIDQRGGSSRKRRARMLDKIKHCHWCGSELTLDTSTVEHIIPLARGGLDNANNRTLACKPCNESRGCDMPELHRLEIKYE